MRAAACTALAVAAGLGSPAAAADSMSFLAIGDWGGLIDVIAPTTPGEKANNDAMGAAAQGFGDTQFVLALGDNFYLTGVTSVESKRFTQTFENVFTHPNLQVPWYVIAGNHDHAGNVTAQIEYTNVCPSKRWQFPSMYYTVSKSFTPEGSDKPVTTQIVLIDTVTISGNSYYDHEREVAVKGEGPADAALAGTQLAWLEETLAASTADYLWVVGHYPVYSHCEHGPTSELIRDVLPLMERYNAQGFIAGHDHCLGHYQDPDTKINFVLSGAGNSATYRPSNKDKVPSGFMKFGMDIQNQYGASGGFVSFRVTATETTVVYHGNNKEVLYTADAVLPRTQQ